MAGLLSGLQNLSVFDGVPDAERNRALIQAGLGMMQPQDPAKGEGALTQLTGGINSGLASLDRSEDRRFAEEQRAFENLITGRGATVGERGATSQEGLVSVAEQNADTSLFSAESAQEIGTTNAETNATSAANALTLGTEQNEIAGQNADTSEQSVLNNLAINLRGAETADVNAATAAQNAETSATQVTELARQFDAQLGNRFATKFLQYAKARYYDRLPEAGTISVSEASNIANAHKARAMTLWTADQVLPPAQRKYSDPSDPILIDQAWSDITLRKGQAGTDLGLITQPGEGSAIGGRNQNIADPGLAGVREQLGFGATPQDNAAADAAMAFTPERWLAIIRDGDISPADAAILDRLIDNYPGVRRAATAAAQSIGQ